MLVAYYDVDYLRNPKGTNYWRNRQVLLLILQHSISISNRTIGVVSSSSALFCFYGKKHLACTVLL